MKNFYLAIRDLFFDIFDFGYPMVIGLWATDCQDLTPISLNEMPAYLMFVYFVNDKDMNGPQSIDEWNGALSLFRSYLGIGRHQLKQYIADIFIDIGEI